MKALQITQEKWEKARKLSDKVKKKKNWKHNFYNTQASFDSEATDILQGFVGEFCFAELFHLPEPIFIEDSLTDKEDFLIAGKKCDLKTREMRKPIFVNQQQYERKKGKIDAYIFGAIYGNYFMPTGWISYEELPLISSIVCFPNGSKAFQVNVKVLKKIDKLEGLVCETITK